MAVNESRNFTMDLRMGMSDGRYKSLTPDRGGEVETLEPERREGELPWHYGMLQDNKDCNHNPPGFY